MARVMKVEGARQQARRELAATMLLVLAAGALVVAVCCLLLPTYVEPEGIFFECGSAMAPNVEPHQEPGITACAKETDRQLSDALPWLGVGAVTAVLGVALLLQGRGRRQPQLPVVLATSQIEGRNESGQESAEPITK